MRAVKILRKSQLPLSVALGMGTGKAAEKHWLVNRKLKEGASLIFRGVVPALWV